MQFEKQPQSPKQYKEEVRTDQGAEQNEEIEPAEGYDKCHNFLLYTLILLRLKKKKKHVNLLSLFVLLHWGVCVPFEPTPKESGYTVVTKLLHFGLTCENTNSFDKITQKCLAMVRAADRNTTVVLRVHPSCAFTAVSMGTNQMMTSPLSYSELGLHS